LSLFFSHCQEWFVCFCLAPQWGQVLEMRRKPGLKMPPPAPRAQCGQNFAHLKLFSMVIRVL
jgi:hypothetical protein